MSYLDIVRSQLVPEEGDRKFPYKDQFGNLTIGIGHNLTANGISVAVEELMFQEDVGEAEGVATELFPNFWSLSDARKAVLVDMAFNLGGDKLSLFHGLISAVAAGDWNGAAEHMLASKWAGEVGARATTLEQKMRIG